MRATIDEGYGRHKLVTEMVAGETVGEVALLTRTEGLYTLTAARDTVLAKLSSTGFEKLTSSHPQIILRVAHIVATRLRDHVANKARQHQKGTTFVVTPVHEGFDISDFQLLI